jgi:hypothetical protein
MPSWIAAWTLQAATALPILNSTKAAAGRTSGKISPPSTSFSPSTNFPQSTATPFFDGGFQREMKLVERQRAVCDDLRRALRHNQAKEVEAQRSDQSVAVAAERLHACVPLRPQHSAHRCAPLPASMKRGSNAGFTGE